MLNYLYIRKRSYNLTINDSDHLQIENPVCYLLLWIEFCSKRIPLSPPRYQTT